MFKKYINLILVIFVLLNTTTFAVDNGAIETKAEQTMEYLLNAASETGIQPMVDEWVVIAIAKFKGAEYNDLYNVYYNKLCAYIESVGGKLSERKYTEYSRVVLALSAIGKDPSNVAGYNCLEALGDYKRVTAQGINGPIFALLALDSKGYDMPVCEGAEVQATRELYIENILERQLESGAFFISSDADITAMSLCALAKYRYRADVESSIEKALTFLAESQNETNGYGSAESCAQVLLAMCELGIDINDERFVKGGNTVVQHLMMYSIDGGGFKHAIDRTESNIISTQQAVCALVGQLKGGFYDMTEKKQISIEFIRYVIKMLNMKVE